MSHTLNILSFSLSNVTATARLLEPLFRATIGVKSPYHVSAANGQHKFTVVNSLLRMPETVTRVSFGGYNVTTSVFSVDAFDDEEIDEQFTIHSVAPQPTNRTNCTTTIN